MSAREAPTPAAIDLVSRAYAAGFKLRTDGCCIEFSPAEGFPEDLRQAMCERKSEIIATLRNIA